MLFGYNAGDYQKIPATDLIIQLVLEKDGSLFPVLDTKDLIGLERGVYRPRKSTKSTCLHVHHKLYVKSRLPWEYPDSDLVTLCNWCHWELHEHTIIPVYQEEDNGELVNLNYTPCQRCNGAGVLPEYNHVENGICFKCNGSRYENLITTAALLSHLSHATQIKHKRLNTFPSIDRGRPREGLLASVRDC